jgi:hypothetical protein
MKAAIMIGRFLELLAEATARVPAHYFQLPTAGGNEAIYRERVYCYELYHQLRTLIEGEEHLGRYKLSGEIDKQGHAIIRPCAPDLAFHDPGQMDNLIAVEVKPVNGSAKGVQKDLDSLTYYVSPTVGYQLGVLLVYGHDDGMFSRFEQKFRRLDDQRLRLIWHRQCGERAIPVP